MELFENTNKIDEQLINLGIEKKFNLAEFKKEKFIYTLINEWKTPKFLLIILSTTFHLYFF